MRYDLAATHRLAGVGMWNLDTLEYGTTDPIAAAQTVEMWAALRRASTRWLDQQGAVEVRNRVRV